MNQKDAENSNDGWVWVFHGDNSDSCAAIFTNREKAEKWISEYSLTGSLTKMPINKSIYDWAIEAEFFTPQKDYQKASSFIQRFTSAYLDHYHYIDGHNDSE